MTSKEFLKEYIRVTDEQRRVSDVDGRTLYEVYTCDEPGFTKIVNKTLIHSIIQKAGLTPQHEYLRIDTVGWRGRYTELEEQRSKEVRLNRHLWDLEIAVEHENNKKDWLDELVKLIHIRCPLKVVIGYNHCDERDTGELEKLAYAAECMNMLKAFGSDCGEEYLIIIGNGEPGDKSKGGYTSFDYRGYLYNYGKKKFERLII